MGSCSANSFTRNMRLKKSLSIVLFWSLFVSSIPIKMQAQDEMTVAVLDLEARGISPIEADSLTDRMRSELAETGAVVVIERLEMQRILEDRGFEYQGCTSANCAMEAGKLLGVSRVVTGSCGRFGESFSIDIRLIAAETGHIEKSITRLYRGEVDGLVTEMEKLAWDILDLMPPPGRFLDEQPEVAVAPDTLRAPAASEEQEPVPADWREKVSLRTMELREWMGENYVIVLGGLAAGGTVAIVLLSGGKEEPPPIGTPPALPPGPK